MFGNMCTGIKKTAFSRKKRPFVDVVPKAGLEPARGVTTLDFESSASANSATSAYLAFLVGNRYYITRMKRKCQAIFLRGF